MASKVFLTITTWVGIFVLDYNNDKLNRSLQNMLILRQFFIEMFLVSLVILPLFQVAFCWWDPDDIK